MAVRHLCCNSVEEKQTLDHGAFVFGVRVGSDGYVREVGQHEHSGPIPTQKGIHMTEPLHTGNSSSIRGIPSRTQAGP
jgi:hypothetical protein